MNPTSLRTFLAVRRHMNYTRAAEELFLTQPAVSRQIRQLAPSASRRRCEVVWSSIFSYIILVHHSRTSRASSYYSCTRHSSTPPERSSCSCTSIRSAAVVIVLNRTLLNLSRSTPNLSSVATGFHWSLSL